MAVSFLVQSSHHFCCSVMLVILPCVTSAGGRNKFTPAFFRACLFLPSQKSWELFHFVSVRWQMPSQEQKHKHLRVFHLFSRIISLSVISFHLCLQSFHLFVSKEVPCRYPVHRIAVSNLISAPAVPYSNLSSKKDFFKGKKWGI